MSDDFFFDPGQGPDLIPPDNYVAQIIEATITTPSTGDGHMLNLTWKISDGDQEGRQVWQRLCYDHSSAQTRDIAQNFLRKLCRALNIHEAVVDAEVFKFKPVRVWIDIEVDKKGQYDDSNVIKRVWPLTEADNESAEAKAAAKTSPAASAPKPFQTKPAVKPSNGPSGTVPWKKA